MNKLLSCRFNMDTNRVEARFADGSTVAIDCTAIEDEYGDTPAQRAELDWLLYNKPLPSLCWVGRWGIIFPSAATMADWKIDDSAAVRKKLKNHLYKGHCYLRPNRI